MKRSVQGVGEMINLCGIVLCHKRAQLADGEILDMKILGAAKTAVAAKGFALIRKWGKKA